jgi:hypothetical protein
MMKCRLLIAWLLIVLCTGWSNIAAAKNASDTEGWHFLVAPYLWASAIRADVTVGAITRDFHLSFSDILRHFEFGVQGHLEASHGPWSIMLDPTYLKLSAERDQGLVKPKLTSQTVLIDTGVFYRIFSRPMTASQSISFEILGGARYLNVRNALDFPIGLSVSGRTQLAAPIVGGRFKVDITPVTHAWLRGDVGGFHVDNVNHTWNLATGISYSINPHVELALAYRALNIHFNKGNATTDMLMYGPMAGVGVRF